ncbi:MAG: hypothetical protein JRF24_07650 [Deltaproteobacteria bacterium]|nr:hypothetical protein [Deltaproteobacteria bacterium]
MLEEIKKGLLAGFGAVLLTKEKIDEVSRNDAKLSKEDAQKLAKELIETGDRRWQDLEKTVTENVRKGLEIRWKTPLTASPLESLLRR